MFLIYLLRYFLHTLKTVFKETKILSKSEFSVDPLQFLSEQWRQWTEVVHQRNTISTDLSDRIVMFTD